MHTRVKWPWAIRRTAATSVAMELLLLVPFLLPGICAAEAFNVPAQPATTGIPEFARQADIQILVPERIVRGVRTADVVGDYSIRGGLARLLSGTNLNIDSSDDHTLTLGVQQTADTGASDAHSKPLLLAALAPEDDSAPTRAPAASATSPVTTAGLEEIVVTATRRETSISNTPISITALSGTDLERSRVVTMDDVARLVPSLVYMPQSASETYLSIRGTSTIDDSTGSDQGVSMFVDDVARTGIADLQPDLYDMDRVEVLKGPQGTLFGRNSLGGVMSLYTRQPVFKTEGSAEVSYGEDSLLEAKGMFNTALIDNELAARVVMSGHANAGYLPDPVTRTDVGKLNRWSTRAKLLFTPSDDLRVVGGFDYLTERGDAPTWINLNFVPSLEPAFPSDPNQTSQADPGLRQQNIWGLSARADLTKSMGTWTSITGYRHLDALDRTLETGDPLDVLTLQTTEFDRQFTEELRFASRDDRKLTWVGGLYYLNSDKSRPITGVLNVIPNSAVAIHRGPGPADDPGSAFYDASQATRTISYAAFADVTYAMTDQFKVNLGGRYTYESKSGFANLNHSNHFFGPAISGVYDDHWTAFTPKLTLDYKPVESLLAYATASRGFQSGGFNTQGGDTPSLSLPFESEYVWNYEAGLKFDGLDHRLQINASAFVDRYTQLQVISFVTTTGGVFTGTNNAGAAEVDGLESEIQVAPANWLTLGVRYDYLRSKFTSYLIDNGPGSPPTDYSGNKVPFAAPHRLTASFDLHSNLHNDRGRVAFGGDYSYRSAMELDAGNDTPDYIRRLTAWHGLINLHASWTSVDERYEVALFGQNITNIHYGLIPVDLSIFVEAANGQEAGNPDAHLFNMRPGPPQSIGITFRTRF